MKKLYGKIIPNMHVVIFTGGIFRSGKKIITLLQTADMIIAADSGAQAAKTLHVIPQTIIGDFDSLDSKTLSFFQKKNVPCIKTIAEKDETDTQLAIQYAKKHGATQITILNGIEGDRIDHILANIFLALDTSIPIRFMNGTTTVWVEKEPKHITIAGKPNDLLSLIPLSANVTDIETKYLQYPLHKETLMSGNPRGVSNVFLKKNVEVKFSKGTLLFVHIDRQK